MTDFPFDILTRTISEAEPCGPSLEMADDDVYMQFTARLEGQLPQSFLRFDRSQIDFKAEFATLQKLLSSSIDISLIVLLAKLLILDRDLEGFAKAVVAIRDCLRDRWDHVHPQPLDGDPIMRIISLQTLDDMPTSLMPLQAVPLFKARRFGAVSFRSHLIAEGTIQQASTSDEDEDSGKAPSPSDVRAAISEADIDSILASRAAVATIHATVGEIESLFDDHSGQPGLLRFPNLKPLSEAIRQFLESCVAIKDPSLATVSESSATDGEDGTDHPPATAGPIASLVQARQALLAAAAYYSAQEPSSPVRMILAQAEALVGKSFYEALQSMIPDHFGQAVMKLGRDLPLTISVERLSQLLPTEYQEETSYDDAGGSDNSQGMTRPAATRAEAMQLIDQVSNFFRSKEPSSPIPILLEQARQAAGRDFVGLLRDFLPGHILAVDG
jgi:type VI secretion system protein ImpA